jgi:hypothetical protein
VDRQAHLGCPKKESFHNTVLKRTRLGDPEGLAMRGDIVIMPDVTLRFMDVD